MANRPGDEVSQALKTGPYKIYVCGFIIVIFTVEHQVLLFYFDTGAPGVRLLAPIAQGMED